MTDLIERYIYAVTKRLPRKNQEDVSRELRSLVDDMLTERCGALPPTEKDIRVVLTELGSPQELYEKYDEDSQKCLIGPPYYSTYKFILKIVLSCVVFGLSIASILLQLTEPQVWYAAFASWLAMLWQGLMGSFAFVTILFAVFYRKGIQINEPFNFDDLPPVPKKKQEISTGESIFGIAISILFLIVFLAVPQIFCVVISETGTPVPIFTPEVIRSSWYIIVLFALVGIFREAVKLLEKQYNKRVMVTTIISDILSALLSFWWLGGFQLVNPEFTAYMADLFGEEGAFIVNIFAHFQYFFLGILLFALVLDMGTAIVKSLDR